MLVGRLKYCALWLSCLLSVNTVAEPLSGAPESVNTAAESVSAAAQIVDKEDSFLSRLAAVQEKNREFDASAENYQELTRRIEERDGSYSEKLIEPLTGLGRVRLEQRNYEQAETLFRRAQHLSHRSGGVHTPRQKEIIDLLTRIHMELDQPLKADQQQRFSLYISEQFDGRNSTQLLPALYKMARWYLETGQFSRSRKIYERAAELIKGHFGDQHLMLVEALRGIATTRQLQAICCSYKALQQVLTILKSAENIQPAEIALAMAELADGYSVSKKKDQARELYRQAWLMLQNEPESEKREILFRQPEQIAMSKKIDESRPGRKIYMARQNYGLPSNYQLLTENEEMVEKNLPPQMFTVASYENQYRHHINDLTTRFDAEQKTREVIGIPVQFLYEQLKYILPHSLHDPETLAQLFIELEFTVREDGSVTDIVISETNAPNKLIRTMKQALRKSRFRPRMQQGEPIATKNVQLTQVFK